MYYLFYKETMQHRAVSLMSRKLAAAMALEGEFSEEGLAAMAGDDNMQMALAKSMAERIDQADMQRSWSKIKSGDKKKSRRLSRSTERDAGSTRPNDRLSCRTRRHSRNSRTPNARRSSAWHCILTRC